VTGKANGTSVNRTARVAGVLYLLVFPLAFFTLSVRDKLIVHGDAAATASNIMASGGLFPYRDRCRLASQTIFIFLLLVLYRLLKPVNSSIALQMVVLLLVSVPIAVINELNQCGALMLLSGAAYLTPLTRDQLHVQAMFHLDLHR
jgi:hypothetical protein